MSIAKAKGQGFMSRKWRASVDNETIFCYNLPATKKLFRHIISLTRNRLCINISRDGDVKLPYQFQRKLRPKSVEGNGILISFPFAIKRGVAYDFFNF
jgi:hypothetical protein